MNKRKFVKDNIGCFVSGFVLIFISLLFKNDVLYSNIFLGFIGIFLFSIPLSKLIVKDANDEGGEHD